MARYSLVNAGQIGTTGTYTEVKDYSSQEHVNPVTGFARRRINFKNFLAAAGISVNATSDLIAMFQVKKGQLCSSVAWATIVTDTKSDAGAAGTCNLAIGDETAPDTLTAPTSAPTSLIASFDVAHATTKLGAGNTQKMFQNDGVITLQVLGDGGAGSKRPKDAVIEVAVAIADVFPFLRSAAALAGNMSLV